MALCRIRRPEQLRHQPPGELGRSVGLGRVPEVRTLREEISILAATGTPGQWMRELSKTWMKNDQGEAAYLCPDGHVRVYHYDIEGLVEYGSGKIPGTTRAANPAWRELNNPIARHTTRPRTHQAKTLTDTVNMISYRAGTALLADLTAAGFRHPETGHRFIDRLV